MIVFQNIDLRDLSELEAPENAFVSLYFSGPDGLNSLHQREERIRAVLQDEPIDLEHFERTMERVRALLDDNPVDAQGMCVFGSWALDLVRGYPLTVALPNLLRVGSSPYIRPLAEIQEEYENFVIVAADNSSTRILTVTSAVAKTADTVRGGVKNQVKKGGWSQKRYARRRDNQLHHYAEEINEHLEKFTRSKYFDRVILLGSKETLIELEEVLSPQAAEKVIGKKAIDLHEGDQAILDEAYEMFFAEERESEERLWERIKGEYLGHGLAAVGPGDVLQAATVGRVEVMAVTRDARIPGVRCGKCENVAHGSPDTCPVCGSKDVIELELVNELVRHLELTSAEVDFVDPVPGLTEVGDVAALLRY